MVGIGGDHIAGIARGELTAVLLVWDQRQYDEIKAELASAELRPK
jgi:hypothetical protein